MRLMGKLRTPPLRSYGKQFDRNKLEVHIHGPGDHWLRMSAEGTKRVPSSSHAAHLVFAAFFARILGCFDGAR
jgi:hypothetical protein